METVLRAPFARPGARAAGVGRQPGGDRRAAAAAGAARRRGRRRTAEADGRDRLDLELPAEPADVSAGRAGRARPAPTCAACCSASTSTRDDRGGRPGRLPGRAGRARAAGHDVVAGEIELLDVFADLAELSRNRPAGEELHSRAPRAQPPRVLPHLPAEPRRRAGRRCRSSSATGSPRCSAHYGVDRPRPHARAGGGGLPDLPGPAARGAPTCTLVVAACCSSWLPSRRRRRRCASRPARRSST